MEGRPFCFKSALSKSSAGGNHLAQVIDALKETNGSKAFQILFYLAITDDLAHRQRLIAEQAEFGGLG